MNIDWQSVITGSLTFLILLVIKLLLDLKLVQLFVKYCSWLPVRNFFRSKPVSISGKWEQTWESADSESFEKATDRHSHPEIKQLGSYCYAEFIARGVSYVLFGRVVDSYVVGDWYDKEDPLGYFGAFQLEIINSEAMRGKWIGHSKIAHVVKGDEWHWRKLS